MIQLPNACYCSALKVHPQNWKTTKASLSKDWFIYYRFYDPLYKSDQRFKKGLLVRIKGMNHYKTRSERQAATAQLLEEELRKLKEKGYHPIAQQYGGLSPVLTITPDTPFITGLVEAEKNIKVASTTKRDLRGVLSFVTQAAKQLNINQLPVEQISRKHIKLLLAQVDANRGGESAHRFNKLRSYLMILFNELVELEVVPSNPVREISKKSLLQAPRSILTPEERKTIDGFLKAQHYRLWLFTHIFFHSGARITEMLQVKGGDVNLVAQTFTITIKKGSVHKRVAKPIKDIALPYWLEAVQGAGVNDFVFSSGLNPGVASINAYQITKRWNRHIKKKLGIDKDFYSLKHLNLDETAALLSIQDAALMASHTSTHTTLKHYAVGERGRQQEKLKVLNNPFA